MKKVSIGKVICLARSYKKHADEMNSFVPPAPLLFLKPNSAVIFSGDTILVPKKTNCVHHEVELGVVMGEKCSNIDTDSALQKVLGYLIGLDITARDLQDEAKKNGWPWSIAKGFDTFAPFSDVIASSIVTDPNDLEIALWVNEHLRQKGSTKDLVWSVEEIISFVSSIMTLERGDVILTGTPKGVGPIYPKDRLRAELSDHDVLCRLEVSVDKN